LSCESLPSQQAGPGKSKNRGLGLPAVQALVMQCLSLLLLYVFLQVAWAVAGIQTTLVIAVLLQGVIAAALSFMRRQSSWWLAIHFFFPIALVTTYSLDFPPGVFLFAFLLFLGLYWTVFKTRVPLYLSPTSLWQVVAELLPKEKSVRFIDIGSGLGGLVLHLAKYCPKANVEGIELAPVPWLVSWLRARLIRSRAHFIQGDYQKIDFSQFDVVFVYLSPVVMDDIWEKANAEMRSGALLLSYEFPISGLKPDIFIETEQNGAFLYGWYIAGISHKQDCPLQFP